MHNDLLKGTISTAPCSTSMGVARANMVYTNPRRKGDRGCDFSHPVSSSSGSTTTLCHPNLCCQLKLGGSFEMLFPRTQN